MLGRTFGRPVTVTARGSDINVLPNYALPRRLIRRAARQADGVIAVSSALAGKLAGLGVEQSRITVLRNGGDPAVVRPVTPLEHGEGPPPRPLAVHAGSRVPLTGTDLDISARPGPPGFT